MSYKVLSKEESEKANYFLLESIKVAKNATCNRSKCGSVIVSNGEIIGKGSNTPPNNKESQRRCSNAKSDYNKKVTDKTCCIHAEQRAIIDALKKNPDKIQGSRLYFIRLGENDEPKSSGEPYCTICSKMALDVGISEFVLWRNETFCVYDTEKYNNLSYQYSS